MCHCTQLSQQERRCPGPRGRTGFSVVELLFVLLIASTLAGMAFPRFHQYMSARTAVNARDAFAMAAARARAAAVQRGDAVVLMIRPYRDSVFVMSADAHDTLEVLDYKHGLAPADLLMESGLPAPFRICYVARGFAIPGCGDGSRLPVDLGFRTQSDTLWVTINAAGRVER